MSTEHPQRELARVSDLVFNKPWAISECGMDLIAEIVDRHATGNVDLSAFELEKRPNKAEIEGALSIIPIEGPIMRRASMMGRMSGARTLAETRSDFSAAMTHPGVRVVLLDIDSPGGEVTGIAEFATVIRKAATESEKLIVAFTDGEMNSAAYFLGSQANLVVASPSSIVGSIGVVMKLTDTSRLRRNAGVDDTVIKTGPNKQIGSGTITPEQIGVLQSLAEGFFDQFKEAVFGARGELSAAATDGRVFTAANALEENLVDRVQSFDELKRDLIGRST